MSDRQALREAIVVLRMRAGLSQKKLAGRAEVSDSYLNRIERGHSEVGTATLARISSGLGVELSRLIALAELLQEQRVATEPVEEEYADPGANRSVFEVREELDRVAYFYGLEDADEEG
jgi:transcriptional regulator with XRE-family HTH domain